MYPFIHLKNFSIPVYGICLVVGILGAMLISLALINKRGKDPWLFIAVAAISFALGFAGAKILYILITFPVSKFFKVLFLMLFSGKTEYSGGFVFYGGLFGGLLGYVLGCKICSVKFNEYIEETAVFVPFTHAFGRIGCFFAGCCYGKEMDWSISNVLPRFPVQLVEAMLLFAVFAFILVKYLKGGKHLFIWYGVFYSVIRFCLEFLRDDEERGFVLGLSTSQFISILLFAGCFCVLFFTICTGKRDKNKISIE